MTRVKKWRESEVDYIKNNYQKIAASEIAEHLNMKVLIAKQRSKNENNLF